MVNRANNEGFSNRAARFFRRRFMPPTNLLVDYNERDWFAELNVLVKANINRSSMVHVLYGDEQLDTLLRWRRLLPCPLVATFHLPTDRDYVKARFEGPQKNLLRRIDAAIVVSKSQLPDFRRWLGPDRVVYIPHGIDTQLFSPQSQKLNDGVIRLVSVGEHMRDFEALHCIMDECRILKLNVVFDVVVPRSIHAYFFGCTNVRLHAEITEKQLIDLYHKADALLLPVTDATANNAVLESMACGTPIISTAIGGIPDYVDETAGWLFPKGDVKNIVELIIAGSADPSIFHSKRVGTRIKSLDFDWQQIVSKLRSVYMSIRNNTPFD